MAAATDTKTRRELMQERMRGLDAKLSRVPGVGPAYGLMKGLGVTLKTMTRRSVTQQYPRVKPDLPARSRQVIALKEENCTVCMLCSRECPDWCIYIDSHKDVVPPKGPGQRARTRNVLDRFAIDYALCMYCGICVEVCPFDALFWAPHFEYSVTDIDELTHEMPTLAEWMDYVKPPPPFEQGADPAKEEAAEAKMLGAPAVSVAEARVVSEAGPAGTGPAATAPGTTAPAMQPTAAGGPDHTPVSPVKAEVAAGAGSAVAAPPAPGAATEDDHAPPEIDEETYRKYLSAGRSEREARALAKKAWVLKRRKGRS